MPYTIVSGSLGWGEKHTRTASRSLTEVKAMRRRLRAKKRGTSAPPASAGAAARRATISS